MSAASTEASPCTVSRGAVVAASWQRNFRKLMGEAGDLAIPKHMHPYPRMQMLTVEQILAGETFHTPGARGRGDRQFDWIGASSASSP